MAELIKKTDTLNQGREKLNTAITDAETAKNISAQADDKATQALTQSESTQTQLDTIVINGDSSVEAAQARVSSTGTAYGTLKQRLDSEYQEVTTQLAQIAINVENFPRLEGEVNDSKRIQRAIDYAIETNNRKIYFPANVYVIGETIEVKESMHLFGVYGGNLRINESNYYGSTVFTSDVNYTQNTPMFLIDPQEDYTRPTVSHVAISGLYLENLVLLGTLDWNDQGLPVSYAGRTAIKIQNVMSEYRFDNIFISRFLGQALDCIDLMDGTWTNVRILSCGTEGLQPALRFDSYQTNTNAAKIFGLHMEGCPWFIELNHSKHNQFIGCKFELGRRNIVGNSHIVINPNAGETVFSGCQFVYNYNDFDFIPIEDVPYFFEINNQNTIISDCMFASSTTNGSKWIEGRSCLIDNNTFLYANTDDYAFKFNYDVVFTNNRVSAHVTSNKMYLFNVVLENKLEGNRIVISNPNQTPLTEGLIFNLTGDGNYLNDNRITGTYFKKVNTDKLRLNWLYEFQSNLFATNTVTDNTLTVVDVGVVPNTAIKTIRIQPADPMSVSSFEGVTHGSIVTVIGNSNVTLKNRGVASRYFVLKDETDLVMTNNQVVQFFYNGSNFLQIS